FFCLTFGVQFNQVLKNLDSMCFIVEKFTSLSPEIEFLPSSS
ncbi:hypothetical protein HMPREF3228_01367, partial [Streptococcus mitis]